MPPRKRQKEKADVEAAQPKKVRCFRTLRPKLYPEPILVPYLTLTVYLVQACT